LAKHTSSADLGLRLRGEQLAAGVRFVRMLEEGTYHLVVGNPPYQGTGKLEEAGYVQKNYSRGQGGFVRGVHSARVWSWFASGNSVGAAHHAQLDVHQTVFSPQVAGYSGTDCVMIGRF
jgi:hypothetical protein